MMTLSKIKDALRYGPYAWPGGYPLYFVTNDGEPLSFKAVRENFREVVSAHICNDKTDAWALHSTDINWEDPALFCAHTNERIESAYAETEEH